MSTLHYLYTKFTLPCVFRIILIIVPQTEPQLRFSLWNNENNISFSFEDLNCGYLFCSKRVGSAWWRCFTNPPRCLEQNTNDRYSWYSPAIQLQGGQVKRMVWAFRVSDHNTNDYKMPALPPPDYRHIRPLSTWLGSHLDPLVSTMPSIIRDIN